MSKFSNMIIFILGAGIGSVTTWFCVKKKYEQIAQEEIDSVKEVFSKKEKKLSNEIDEAHEKMKENEEVDYATIAKLYSENPNKREFMDYSAISSEKQPKGENDMNEQPYVISPDEFGEIDAYEKISLSYYNDQILADEDDVMVEDIENTIGCDSLNHFGEYEDDSVFVRNNRLKCDYEILIDHRNFSDVVANKPN